jgi:hypothetical protein
MNQEMKNRLLRLKPEALVEILESVCGYAEIEIHYGQDPMDCINDPVFYAYEAHCGSWTVLNYDSVLHDKPKHNIDMDPAKTYIIRVEGDKDQILRFLDGAEPNGLDSYEIVKYPDGVEIPASRQGSLFPNNTPIKGFTARIKWYEDPLRDQEVFIAQTPEADESHPQYDEVFFFAGDFTEEEIRKEYSYRSEEEGSAFDWYIDNDAKDLDVPVDPDANRLHLYAVWTINADTSETEKVYIMALHEEGAACLYHQSRARDHGNILCEIVVSKVADSEVCDG